MLQLCTRALVTSAGWEGMLGESWESGYVLYGHHLQFQIDIKLLYRYHTIETNCYCKS